MTRVPTCRNCQKEHDTESSGSAPSQRLELPGAEHRRPTDPSPSRMVRYGHQITQPR